MSEHHLDRHDFERLAAGELSQEETTLASHHLLSCSNCRQTLARIASDAADLLKALLSELLNDEPMASSLPEFASGSSFGENESTRRAVDVHPADLLLELQKLPSCERRAAIRQDSRYHRWELAEAMLQESWNLRREEPLVAEELAHQALEISSGLEGHHEDRAPLNDFRSRAWAYIANARRIVANYPGAQEAFHEAERLLARGTRDPLKRAELLAMEGTLLRDQHRFEDSEKNYDQALAIYRWAGDRQGQCECLINKARTHEAAGDLDRAVETLGEASGLVDRESDPFLLLCVWQNLVTCLIAAGEAQEARELLPAVQKLSTEVGQRNDGLRLRWLEGLVARDLRDARKAEAILREVREEFIRAQMGIDAALVSLDLAALLLREGRTGETKQLAEEMLRIFSSLDIRREAFAALIVFQQAALQEEATVKMVRDIADYLKLASSNPALRYENPS